MADLTNFAEWDPGVVSSVQVEGDGIELDAGYDVTVRGFRGPMTLRYRVTELDAPRRLVARAKTSLLTSDDTDHWSPTTPS